MMKRGRRSGTRNGSPDGHLRFSVFWQRENPDVYVIGIRRVSFSILHGHREYGSGAENEEKKRGRTKSVVLNGLENNWCRLRRKTERHIYFFSVLFFFFSCNFLIFLWVAGSLLLCDVCLLCLLLSSSFILDIFCAGIGWILG